MANYRSTVLDSGNTALLKALGEGIQIPVGRFRVGDGFNFVPDKTSTAPVGSLVYTGGHENIGLSFTGDANNELRIDVNFKENVGDFPIGNIIIDLLVEDEYIPFLMWSSDFQIPKWRFNTETGKIGNVYVFSFTEKLQNVDEALNISILPVVYASLPQYEDENALPPASAALFQNPVLQTYGKIYRPVITVRRSVDDNYFGYELMERLDNPFFGTFDEGIVGRINAPYTGKWIWGGYIETKDSEYGTEINGGSLTTPDSEYGIEYNGGSLADGAE